MTKEYYGFVYLTTNLVNGKRYIGQTTRKESFTYFGSGKAIRKAIVKYGKENFTREILAYSFTKADLDFVETHLIEQFGAQDKRNFYNIAEGGKTTKGFTGKSHTKESREAIRNHLLKTHPNKGKEFSSTVRGNMSESKKGYSYGVWTLEVQGSIIEVSCLTSWCKEKNIDYGSILKTRKTGLSNVDGVKAISFIRTRRAP